MSLPIHFIVDPIRLVYLVILKLSSSKYVFIISNQNHRKNILNYIPEVEGKYKSVYIKNQKTLATVPLSPLVINGVYNLIFLKAYSRERLSNLDVTEALYHNSEWYFGLLFFLLKPDIVFMSREDTEPFVVVAKSIQKNKLSLAVVEHGIFVRNYHSFECSVTTSHVYSSLENVLKRTPKALRIIATRNPIQDIYQAFLNKKLAGEPTEILVADTHNIRPNLSLICEKILTNHKVCLRHHPGQQTIAIPDVRLSQDKIEDLRMAKLVVTGTSGLALEAAMCGIPTLIIRDPSMVWLESSLKIFSNLPNILLLDLEEFMNCDFNSLPISRLSDNQIYTLHQEHFFHSDDIIGTGSILQSIKK